MIELIDTSAWALRQRESAIRRSIDDAILEGRAATCPPITLELLHSARNVEEFRRVRSLLRALHQLPVGPAEWERAVDVYEALAAQGGAHQRAVKHPDLLAAAAAEAAGAMLVHYDEDYDRIASITGQPTRWAAPRGSI
jgi:predicted nucleic acid-binding protein